MTGRIIHTTPEPHDCDPGWILDHGQPVRATPPRGSIWQCTCGQTFVAARTERPPGRVDLATEWRRESRITRWWRELGNPEKRGGYPSGNLTIHDVDPPTEGVEPVKDR